jgi:hypothetical protein
MNLLRKPFFSRALFLLAALPLAAGLLMAPLAAQAQTATPTTPLPRIASPISGATRFTLAGSHPPRVDSAPDRGAVDPSLALSGMAIVFSRSSQQEAALQALLAAQQDPASPQYHQWLTPDQFGTQFGVADSDLAATESWLQQQGFTVSGQRLRRVDPQLLRTGRHHPLRTHRRSHPPCGPQRLRPQRRRPFQLPPHAAAQAHPTLRAFRSYGQSCLYVRNQRWPLPRPRRHRRHVRRQARL